MPLLTEIVSLTDVAVFALWTCALVALARAVFRSFPAAEISYRLYARSGAQKERRASILQWELKNRVEFSKDLAQGSPHAAKRPLSDEQLAVRSHELDRLARGTLLWRAGKWLATCLACQVFWSAVAAGLVTRGVGIDTTLLVSTAFAHMGLSVVLFRAPPDQQERARKGGCKDGNCGH